MKDDAIERLAAWVIERGLDGASETELMQGLCEGCCEAGLPLSRALTIIDTLHPTHEGRAFRWRNDGVEESAVIEYGRTNEGEAAENWRRSAFYHLLTSGEDELRRRLAGGEPVEFAQLQTMQAEGVTDYVALIHRFPGSGSMGEMDCFYSHWTTRQPDGFDERQVAALRKLLPPLALAIKCASLARIAETLVEVYLGRDAGRRVLSGRIQRGVADRIGAVLWFSDLRGYTTISDAAAPDEIIPLLNDYADAVISAVHDAGGDVLKLMGDGVLAIFKADEPADACLGALRAEADLRLRLRTLNARRAAEGRPVTSAYLGLHIGDVFYGNIGSQDRSGLYRRRAGGERGEPHRLHVPPRSIAASSHPPTSQPRCPRRVGRYALRSVGRAQELFTIDPEVLIANGDLA